MKKNFAYHHFISLLIFAMILVSCKRKPHAHISPTNSELLKAIKTVTTSYVVTDSMVRSIYEDRKGNYWFGRDHAGLSMYDGKSLIHYNMEDGLPSNQIRTIQEDQNGNIWFATGYGVAKYDGESFTTQKATLDPILGMKLESQWAKDPDDLWFNGEVEGGIYRYDGHKLSVLEFPTLDSNHVSTSIEGTVTGICQGKNNMLWMANYGGVIGYDGKDFRFINERKYMYHVRSLYEDSKGILWIGNNGIGVLRYDGEKTINFTKKMGVNDHKGKGGGAYSPPGTLNHVFAIVEDHLGNIWFGDRDTGAWRYDGKSLTNYTEKNGLSNTMVRSIYKDRSGELIFGLGDGSVSRFDGNNFVKYF